MRENKVVQSLLIPINQFESVSKGLSKLFTCLTLLVCHALGFRIYGIYFYEFGGKSIFYGIFQSLINWDF